MAGSQGIRSRSRAQSRAPKRKRRRKPPLLPPPVIIRRGKTTIRRYRNRSFHRLEEVKGKTVDFVEFYTSGEYHAVDVRFQDKTALHMVIDPRFTLDTEYSDWKTGDRRAIKKWPQILSQTLRA